MAEQIKTYSQMRKDFYEKYQRKIVPSVRRYNAERKKKYVLSMLIIILCTVVAMVIAYFAITFPELDSEARGDFLQFATYVFLSGLMFKLMIKKNFEKKIKLKIMPIVCSCFENIKWINTKSFDSSKFLASGVITAYSREKYDDIFSGMFKDVKFNIVEARYINGYGKNSKTVFNGVIIELDMNKSFSSHTIITPNSIIHNISFSNLKHTVLEDVEFEKKFDVFTNDEVEARYLITPSFMQRLKSMKTAFKADKIKCAFYGQNLIIALSTDNDLFSICELNKPLDDSVQYFQMYEEIVSIIKLIDHFKLDQKIGL